MDLQSIDSMLGIMAIVVTIIFQWVWMKFKVDQTDKDLKKSFTDIEDKRLTNVKALREIYDQKVEDCKNHSKTLFEIREYEFKDIASRLGALELKFDKQNEMLYGRFEAITKSLANIEAHIKTCPYKIEKK